jgi:glutaredoxin 3
MAQVEMYSIQYCPFCVAAKALLDRKSIEYVNHDLSNLSDRDLRSKVLELSGRTTVPQIWINGNHIGGCTDLEALDRSGELDRLLNSE